MIKSLHVIGLTGGIASGKSTVAGWFRQAGSPVIDADQLGRLVLDKDGEAFAPVVEAFGKEILQEDGTIDRIKLGAKVFGDKERRNELEAITHPAIARLAGRGLEIIEERGERLAFYEAALLVETGAYKGLDGLVVVTCSVAQQMERIIARDGFSQMEAATRIASQYTLEEKIKVADHIIENEGSLGEVETAALRVLGELREQFASDD